MSTPENLPQVFEDDSIDLITLLKQIYKGRRFIILSAFVAAILGVIVALATPNSYTSGATFIPQMGGDSKSSSSLSGLASLAGISLGGMGGGSDIPPTLYPQIISSIPYKLDLLDESIEVSGSEISLGDYLGDDSESKDFSILKKNTNDQSGINITNLRFSSIEIASQPQGKIFQISASDRKIFNLLDRKLTLSINDREGIIKLSFNDRNKFVASQVAELAMELLQARIIAFKNQSARELLDFTLKQYHENKIIYEALQDSIAIFKDQNLNISSSLYKNRLDRLERELNIASSVVEQLASQVEQAKLQVNKDTPVFTIIEPVTVPFQRSAPKRKNIVILWTFFGLAFSIIVILIKNPVKKIIDSIRE